MNRLWTWFYGQPYVLGMTTMTFWAANFVIGRGIRADVPPVTLAFLRWSGAFLIIAPFALRYVRRDWPVLLRHWRLVLAVSIFGIAAFNTLAYVGLQYTTAINGMLFQSSAPIMIAIFVFAIHAERPSLFQVSGIVISIAGVLYVICQGDMARLAGLSFNRGDLWILAAFTSWGIYTALLRRRPDVHWLSFLSTTFFIGMLALVPFAAWEMASGRHINAGWSAAGAIVFLMLFPSLFAFICYNRAVELAGGNAIAPLFHTIAVIGSILAIVFLGESPQTYHLIGFALIMAGVLLASRKGLRNEAVPPA